MEKNKRIVLDMAINIIGTAFPLIVLQIIIYPLVAQKISGAEYGELQSVMSSIYLIGGTLGGTLSTTRLVKEYDYKENNVTGDFNILLLINGAITLFLSCAFFAIYFKLNLISVALNIILSILNYSQNYLEVEFRLKIDYKKIFICKVLMAIGYIIGFAIFFWVNYWQLIFIFSLLLPLIYCLINTHLLKEPMQKTFLFRMSLKTFVNFGIANFMNKALTYFDKLLLFPILGGEAVSVYFAANIFGKLILQVLEPITNVILSYVSQGGKLSTKIWKTTTTYGFFFCMLMYIICLIISKPVLYIFYPQWAEPACKLLFLTTASLCISSFTSILNPLVLKFLPSNKQIIINGMSLTIYVILVAISCEKYGLIGCCVALFVSYLIKLLIMIYLCFKNRGEEY